MQIGKQNYPFTDVVEVRTQAPVKTKAINVQIGPGDVVSNIPVIMDFEHHQVHEGETFKITEHNASLDTSTVKYSLVIPTYAITIRAPHLVVEADIFNGSAMVQIYEGATFTGGTPMTIWNRNRNVLTASAISVNTGVTSTNGNLIDQFFCGSGGKATANAGRTGSEWVLKSNTTYRVDLIGLAAGTDSIISFNWYEDLGV